MNFYIFLLTKWKVGIAREILQHKICEKRVFFEIQETFQNCMISLAFRFKIFETLRVSMTSIAGCSCISYTRQGASRVSIYLSAAVARSVSSQERPIPAVLGISPLPHLSFAL